MSVGSIGSSNSMAMSSGVSSAQGSDVLQQLKQLQTSDPAKFKQVAAEMAKSLRADAQTSGGAAGQKLSKLADTLDQAAQSGKLPEPNQAQGAKGKHGHHHHAEAGAGARATDTAASAPPRPNGESPVSSDLVKAFSAALDALAEPGGTTSSTASPTRSAT